ncbi:aminotransferase [Acinetobacter sp. UBA3106]|uniref:aminotransferase n=1 Tax=Acinetobacter sp. UBA3106 TaxID=1945936 RepID=UPI0025C0934A|nr:aminotransferase [Acinetobacter sp. UBA3106]
MLKLKILSLGLILLPCTSFATVGGPQKIEVLGYESKEQKVYLLRHYQDGRGRLPQLYYYQFKNNKQPEKLIQVNSLYINPKTKKIDYDQDSRLFDKEVAKIKKRLIPLMAIPKQSVKIQVLKKTSSKEKSWYDSKEYIPKYTYQYQLSNKTLKSQIHQAIDYRNGLNISQAYKIPQQQKILAVVKYLGIPFETGYTIEDPVLLTLKK